MTTRHLVDPELLAMLDLLPMTRLSAEGLAEIRAGMAAMGLATMGAPTAAVEMDERWAAGLNGAPDVRLLVYRPLRLPARAPALLRIHGGGYVFGKAEMGDATNRSWAESLGCVIVSVEYRLAPDTPFPGPLEDCYAALTWLHAQADVLGLDPARIAIRGESAGGGLAAALALMARERGGPAISHQNLIYPMLDDRTGSTAARNPTSGEFVWTAQDNAFGWASLLGHAPGGEAVHHHAAAARADDLAGLPPTFIGTAALDIFVDENLDYAKRLMHAGVPTELYLAPGAFHGFEAVAPAAAVSRVFTGRSLDALRRAFKG